MESDKTTKGVNPAILDTFLESFVANVVNVNNAVNKMIAHSTTLNNTPTTFFTVSIPVVSLI